MAPIYAALAALACLAAGAAAFSTGAPAGVCLSMTPDHHGVKSQTAAFPYSIKVSPTSVKAGDPVSVVVAGLGPEDTIKGFLVEARLADGSSSDAVGEFRVVAGENVQTRDCGKNPKSAVTHTSTSGAPAKQLTFTWVAPATAVGPVQFYATIAKEWNIFWVGQKSEKVVIG